jgi:dihydroorotate dehydrogenase (NAD+) catalytic subunit
MVWECYQLVKIPIIGMGGITDARDAIEYMLAGATAVQIGTQNFVDPFVWSKVLDGITDYLTRHKVEKLSELIGAFDPTPTKTVHA